MHQKMSQSYAHHGLIWNDNAQVGWEQVLLAMSPCRQELALALFRLMVEGTRLWEMT